jgi:hypothetical protein
MWTDPRRASTESYRCTEPTEVLLPNQQNEWSYAVQAQL